MANTNDDKKSSFFEKITQSIPILSSILLIASLTYDYAFLRALGLSFNDIPSSITEHIRSAILWSPAIIIFLIVLFMYELLIRLSYNGISEEEIFRRKYNENQQRIIKRKQHSIFYGLVFFCTLIITLFKGTDESMLYILFISVYGFIIGLVTTNANMEKLLTSTISRILLFFPVFLVILASAGFNTGKDLFDSKRIPWELSLSQNDEIVNLKFNGIRRFSEFTIAVAENHNISIIPNESILNARMMKPLAPKIINACKWFSFSCEVVKK